MGDRANIIVKEDGEQVCLYTHWGGEGLPNTLHSAMIRGRDRWDDFQYLTRVIFCEMVKNNIEDNAGYSISQKIHDGDDKIIIVDINTQSVQVGENKSQTFSEFCIDPILGWYEKEE